MRGLDGKAIAIIGGAKGIGAATAKRLASEGSKVLIGDINLQAAEEVVHAIIQDGGQAEAIKCDISDEPACGAMMARAKEKWGALHGLFNVAADLSKENLGRDTDVVNIPLDVIERTLKVNLMGYFYTIRHAVPLMLESGGGSIVNTTSGVVLGQPKFAAYGASKGGVIALSRHIAAAYGKRGIRANSFDPGIVITDSQMESNTDEERALILNFVNAPRFGQPQESAALVAFLLSDDAASINGQCYIGASMEGAR